MSLFSSVLVYICGGVMLPRAVGDAYDIYRVVELERGRQLHGYMLKIFE